MNFFLPVAFLHLKMKNIMMQLLWFMNSSRLFVAPILSSWKTFSRLGVWLFCFSGSGPFFCIWLDLCCWSTFSSPPSTHRDWCPVWWSKWVWLCCNGPASVSHGPSQRIWSYFQSYSHLCQSWHHPWLYPQEWCLSLYAWPQELKVPWCSFPLASQWSVHHLLKMLCIVKHFSNARWWISVINMFTEVVCESFT